MSAAAPPRQDRARVAVVCTSYPSTSGDPSGHFVQAEAEELAENGCAVTVFAPVKRRASSPSGIEFCELPGRSAFGWPGVIARLRVRPDRIFGLAAFSLGVLRCHDLHHFDRVVAHWLIPAGGLCALRLLWGQNPKGPDKKLLTIAHGSDVRVLTTAPLWLREGVVGLILKAGTLRFVSYALRDELALACPRLEKAIRCCPVRPSPIRLEPSLDKASARDLLHRDGRFLAVYVARLVPSKRVDVGLLCPELPVGARRVVLGDGPLLRSLARRFQDVEFLGQVPRDVALRWIAAADVVISASRDEGASTVIREARQLGTEVWAARSGDLAQWAQVDSGIQLRRSLESPN